jgi:hypothetical protein
MSNPHTPCGWHFVFHGPTCVPALSGRGVHLPRYKGDRQSFSSPLRCGEDDEA